MRILAIGLGGAGCRIVNSLYTVDRRSSNVACVKAFAVDVDEATLTQLKGLPEEAKIYFPALDPGPADSAGDSTQTATIDIGEVVSRVQNTDHGETDAIFICCGLGGSMVDVAPHIIAALRNSVAEPIFGLVTLPCLAEGERKSVKAADDIDMLSSLLDGIILFDNETWYKKIKSKKSTLIQKEKSFVERMGFKKEQPVISPTLATYLLLNDAIVKRISLILRAGEFKADGGLELAEVVLDSGEILNTMKGMGFITIGYAVELLPHDPLGFLSWLRPAGIVAEDHKKRASRIVELAKQAIYHEISTPCDMTSAHKALVLVAGPSHELSMKGFMTVRKWIDRSIAGLETRSGDYPVVNTQNVAIIIMLSGLENIPRIDEIRGIREQSRTGYQKEPEREIDSISTESITLSKYSVSTAATGAMSQKQSGRQSRDEMIDLPVKEHAVRDSGARSSSARSPPPENHPAGISGAIKKEFPVADNPPSTVTRPATAGMQEKTGQHPELQDYPPQRRVVVSQESKPHPVHSSPVHHPQPHKALHHDTPVSVSREQEPARRSDIHINEQIRTKDTERQRIEKDLQRQRMIAISGRTIKTSTDTRKKPIIPASRTVINDDSPNVSPPSRVQEGIRDIPAHPIEKPPEQKTVIIGKRKSTPIKDNPSIPEEQRVTEPVDQQDHSVSPGTDVDAHDADTGRMDVRVKDPIYRANDDIFGGKGVMRTEGFSARDSGHVITRIVQKKSAVRTGDDDKEESQDHSASEPSEAPHKKRKITMKKDDISWI
ncbi:MAG: tubulin/FtsZ family protein [Methanoregula sp.]|nr:tubulin/FtsZ family protein [Methanoregula sp.]